MHDVMVVASLLAIGVACVRGGFLICRASNTLRYGASRFSAAVVGWIMLLVPGLGSLLLAISYTGVLLLW